jgi:hypothetical protein
MITPLGGVLPNGEGDGNKVATYNEYLIDIIEAAITGIRTPPTFTAPTLLNSWANYGSGYAAAGYVLHNGVVYLRGSIAGGTVNTTLFTLPVGYRPSSILVFATSSNNTHCYIEVRSNGNVVQLNGSNVFLALDTVRFIPA